MRIHVASLRTNTIQPRTWLVLEFPSMIFEPKVRRIVVGRQVVVAHKDQFEGIFAAYVDFIICIIVFKIGVAIIVVVEARNCESHIVGTSVIVEKRCKENKIKLKCYTSGAD